MSFWGRLVQAEKELTARDADPWRLRLERLRGKVDADGIERVTTQTVFDILEIPQRIGPLISLAALEQRLEKKFNRSF